MVRSHAVGGSGGKGAGVGDRQTPGKPGTEQATRTPLNRLLRVSHRRPSPSASSSRSMVASLRRPIDSARRLASSVALGERPAVSTTMRGWESSARRRSSSTSSQARLK